MPAPPGVLYNRYVEVWDGVEQLSQIMESERWRESRFNQRAGVT